MPLLLSPQVGVAIIMVATAISAKILKTRKGRINGGFGPFGFGFEFED